MRVVRLRENTRITHCPKCGNNTIFKAFSSQCAEDACEVWVECECGYDPTFGRSEYRFEDVRGGTSPDNVEIALGVWNDLIADLAPKMEEKGEIR